MYQVIGVLRAGHQGAFASASAHGVFRIVGTRLGLGWIGGNRVTDYVVKSPSVFWPLLGVAVLLAVLVVAIVLRQRRILVFVITSLSFSILVLVVPVWVRGAGPTMVASPVAIGARYVATPILLIWGAVIAEATSVPITGRFGVRNLGVAFCCACLIPIWVIDFRTANERSGGPLWGNEVARRDSRVVAFRPPRTISRSVRRAGLLSCHARISTAHRRRPTRLYGEAPVDPYQSR